MESSSDEDGELILNDCFSVKRLSNINFYYRFNADMFRDSDLKIEFCINMMDFLELRKWIVYPESFIPENR